MKIIIGTLLCVFLVGCLSSSGEDTLLGEDRDKNGVRDDVDRYIEKNFKGQNNQNAVKQLAKYEIESLINRNSKKKLEENSDKIKRAMDCYKHLNLDKKRAFKDLLEISNVIRNTKERILASAKGDQTLGGSLMKVNRYGLEACEFKIIKD
jgi:hypothetical protein